MKSLLILLPFLVILSIGLYDDYYSYAAIEQDVVGINYFDVVNPDGTHTWSSHPDYLLDNGIYVPYVQNGLTVNSAIGDVTLNQDGSYTWNGKFDDKIVGKYADISDLTTWTYPKSINNAVPILSFVNDEFHSNKVKVGVADMDYKYVFVNGKWKTELVVTNLSGLTTKVFGFDQIIDLNSDSIKFGGVTRNLDNFNGKVFDKQFLENNNGKVLELLNGVNFDFDLGFENLHSITVHDTGVNSSQLVFDYRTTDVLLPSQKLIIDPTFTDDTPNDQSVREYDNDNVCEDTGSGSYSLHDTTQIYSLLHAQADTDDCYRAYLEYDVSGIPDGSTFTSGTLTIEVDNVWVEDQNQIYSITTLQPSTETAANVFDAIDDGTLIDTLTTSGTGTYVITFDAGDLTHLESRLVSDFMAFGFKLTSETSDTSYHGLRFHSSTGTTPPELEIIYTVPPQPPDPVTDLTSTAIGVTTIDLDWTTPSAGTGTIIGYQINATTPQTANPLVWLNDTGSTDTDHIVTGLSASTGYSFRVSAWTEVGNDATGNVYNATTATPVPTQPTGLVASAISDSIIDINWDDAPAVDNITGFRIFRESPTGNGWTLHTSNTASSVSALSDTGLATKTQYNYMIAGINGTGVGSNSTAAATTTYGVPDAITDLSLGATSTTITLTWSAPTVYGYPITGYKIEYETPVGGGYATLVANTGTTDVTYLHSGLTAFTQYGYKVTAITSFGNSAASNQPSSYTVTNPPVLNVVNDCYHTCTTQLNLEWSAPTGTITGYKIEHNLNSAGYTTKLANTTNTNVFYNATGYSAGDIVSYRVSAHSAYGTSIPSNAVQYSTHMQPNAVTTLAATETSLSSVVLAWTQPTLNSHSILCNMINYTTPAGDPQTIITSCTSTTAATYEITGLALGDPNSFRVSAVTSHGTNSSGNIVNATAFSDFTIGSITVVNASNTNIVDVRFESAVVGSTTTVDVIYPNTVSDFRCDLAYQYAMTNQTYSGLTATAYDTDYDTSEFNLVDANNEVITFYCWDASAPTVEGTYQVSQTSFPFIDQAMLFRDGTTFKTDGDFGGIDLITLIVIIVSMVGFNRTNPAAGLIISVMILGATSYFGLIEIPTIVMSAFVLIVMLAIVTTRKG